AIPPGVETWLGQCDLGCLCEVACRQNREARRGHGDEQYVVAVRRHGDAGRVGIDARRRGHRVRVGADRCELPDRCRVDDRSVGTDREQRRAAADRDGGDDGARRGRCAGRGRRLHRSTGSEGREPGRALEGLHEVEAAQSGEHGPRYGCPVNIASAACRRSAILSFPINRRIPRCRRGSRARAGPAALQYSWPVPPYIPRTIGRRRPCERFRPSWYPSPSWGWTAQRVHGSQYFASPTSPHMRSKHAPKPPMLPRKSSESRSSTGTSQRTPIRGSAQAQLLEALALCWTAPTTPARALSFTLKYM